VTRDSERASLEFFLPRLVSNQQDSYHRRAVVPCVVPSNTLTSLSCPGSGLLPFRPHHRESEKGTTKVPEPVGLSLKRVKIWTMLLLLINILLLSSAQARRVFPSNVEDRISNDLLLDPSSVGQRRLGSAPVDIPISPDDHLVQNLPLLNPDDFKTQHWAGHLPASADKDKYFFYWLFAPEGQTDSDTPLIIWLNGGPGCTSMDGLFLENGPFHLVKNSSSQKYEIKPAEHSWHKTPAYTLYIDQPVGTGLSFTTSKKYPRNDEAVNTDFYYFLQSFLKLHSDKFADSSEAKVNRPLYFSGESHAGHYIPSMMNYILKQNEDVASGNILIPLSGAAIGNGWMDPMHQYNAAEAAYGHGIIGRAQLAAFAEEEKLCQEALYEGRYTEHVCFKLLDSIIEQSQGEDSEFELCEYDIRRIERTHNGDGTFPPGRDVMETYLGGWDLKGESGAVPAGTTTQLLQAVHAVAAVENGQRFRECSDPPYDALSHQDGKGVVDDVVDILLHRDNIRLFFFNGVQDLACDHAGNERFLENLPWKKRDEWIKTPRYAWKARSEDETKISGYMKEYDNLMFLKVLDAGHMVPMDVPNVALDMIRLFVQGGSFQNSKQALERRASRDAKCPACSSCANAGPSSGRAEPSQTHDDSKVGAFATMYIGIVAFLVFIVVFVFVGIFRRQRRTFEGRFVVPQYDMELEEGQSIEGRFVIPRLDKKLEGGLSKGNTRSEEEGGSMM